MPAKTGLGASWVDPAALALTAKAKDYHKVAPLYYDFPPSESNLVAQAKAQMRTAFQFLLDKEAALQASRFPTFQAAFQELFLKDYTVRCAAVHVTGV